MEFGFADWKPGQRRHFERHAIQAPCRLLAAEGAEVVWSGATENVSRGGALLVLEAERRQVMAPGARCALEVSFAGLGNGKLPVLRASGAVVRVERRGPGALRVALELDDMQLTRCGAVQPEPRRV